MDLIGFFFITILGSLCHFIYEWSNHNKYVAYFCAVNESTWEHLKLAFCPTFIWILIEIPLIGSNPNYCLAKLTSLVVMVATIVILFYGYMALFKKENVFVSIAVFIIAIGLGQYASHLILEMVKIPFIINYLSLIGIIIVFICYMIYTFNPRKHFLFQDPINKKYGISAHMDPSDYKKIKQKSIKS